MRKICSLKYYCFGGDSILGRNINAICHFGSGKSAVGSHDNSFGNINTAHNRHRKHSLLSMCEFDLHKSNSKSILHHISQFFNKGDGRCSVAPVRDGLGILRFSQFFCTAVIAAIYLSDHN